MSTLLAIEDDPLILDLYHMIFQDREPRLETATSAAEGLNKVASCRPDVVLMDVDLPDLSGLETFRQLRTIDPKIPTIFVTGSGTVESAIQAMMLGAYEYLLKPVKVEALRDLVGRAIEVSQLMRVPAVLPDEVSPEGPADTLVGRSPGMQEVYKAIGRVASQNVTVLIQGESGTGKELVARALYRYSRRAEMPFLAINCAAIPETLLESELFGHEQGAFTGADRRRIGKFEQCNGGTLFLDEVGDMTPLTQTKVLRLLQDQQFERVGGTQTVRTDVRMIAATNQDLGQAVAAGRFREDLYYRLNVYAIPLPPLRERQDDLPLLVEHFLRHFGRDLSKEVRRVAPETFELLRQHPWPGNIRELQSTIKHALLRATGPVLLPEFLPSTLRAAPPTQPAIAPVGRLTEWEDFIQDRLKAGSQDLYREWQALTDPIVLRQVLHHTGGNLTQTAKILGINRGTLRTRLDALGIGLEEAGEGTT